MWKSKIFIQVFICIIISGAYSTIQVIDAPWFQEKSASAVAVMSKHYTVSDITDRGKTAVMNIIKAPVTVTSSIMVSQEKQKYGLPLDDLKRGETGSVYATAGGRVEETGENKELGLYVKIAHEDAVSIYGNCESLYVKEHEHIRKGQVIGSFTKDGGDEFYYRLIEEKQ